MTAGSETQTVELRSAFSLPHCCVGAVMILLAEHEARGIGVPCPLTTNHPSPRLWDALWVHKKLPSVTLYNSQTQGVQSPLWLWV